MSGVKCTLVAAAMMAMGHHTFGGERLQAFSDAVFAIVATIMVRRGVGILYPHASERRVTVLTVEV